MRRVSMLALVVLVICVPAAGQNVRSDMIVSTSWLAERLDERVIVVEVGNRNEYDVDHIPGARLLEKQQLMARVDGLLNEVPPLAEIESVFARLGIGDKNRVVFYSRDPLLATRAWFTLDYLGHGHRASVLDGGFKQWVSESRPVTAEVPTFSAAEFNARPQQSAITTFSAMKPLIRHRAALGDALVVIDAREKPGYDGKVAGEAVERPGHIPGAVNVPWQRNLRDESTLFRPTDELRAMYTKLGVNRGTTVVAYCRTGVEATMTYFVLRYLGFDPSVYDGSFTQWSRDDSTPVV